jgi:hypothetical protein
MAGVEFASGPVGPENNFRVFPDIRRMYQSLAENSGGIEVEIHPGRIGMRGILDVRGRPLTKCKSWGPLTVRIFARTFAKVSF